MPPGSRATPSPYACLHRAPVFGRRQFRSIKTSGLRSPSRRSGTHRLALPPRGREGSPADEIDLRAAPTATATPAATGTAAAPNCPEQQEQHHRTDDRGDPGAQIEKRVQGLYPEHRLADEPADQRPDDPDHGGQQQAGSFSGEMFGDEARDGTEHDPGDDAHDGSP